MSAVIGSGRCAVCGHSGEYSVTGAPTLESHECRACGASLRYRVQASAICRALGHPGASLTKLVEEPEVRTLSAYEPGIVGPLRRVLRRLPGYVNSYFWPGLPPGEERDGIRCEDLRALTFDDAAFDLVVSSDILEHVRDPILAFAEIHRVLRPGGMHVFTVPMPWPLPSSTRGRVDWSGVEDVMVLPAESHGSPTDPGGSLVYTDFGMDLPENLRHMGFETVAHHGYRNAITFASRKPAEGDA